MIPNVNLNNPSLGDIISRNWPCLTYALAGDTSHSLNSILQCVHYHVYICDAQLYLPLHIVRIVVAHLLSLI